MLRVCRSTGRLGLAMWIPETFIRTFTVTGGCASPPPMRTLTADRDLEERLEHWFRDSAFDLHTIYREVVFRHRSAEHWVDVLLTSGLVHGMLPRLPQETQHRLRVEMLDLIDQFDIATPRVVDVQSRYLEVVVVKK
jgi:hypothetical protein